MTAGAPRVVLATTNPPKGELDPVSKWLWLTRAGVLPMTLVAAALAGLLAIYRDASVNWLYFTLAALGIVLAHMANNIMNDLFDLQVGTDREDYPRNLYSPHPVLSGAITRRGLAACALIVNVCCLAIMLVLTFIGLPLTVRTIQPVLATFDDETEEAAACLGASRFRTFSYVILPTLYPAMVTGFALAFARALGEYGSVVFVSGNMPYRTEIAPVLIVVRLEEFAYGEATAIAVVLLVISFSMLIIINLLERWSNRYGS